MTSGDLPTNPAESGDGLASSVDGSLRASLKRSEQIEADLEVHPERYRMLTGDRPTGKLHLGHYFGVLAYWVALERNHDCFFFVADWHALTTEYADPSRIKGFVPELVKDWVAGGLDPEKCVSPMRSSRRR